MPDGPSHSHTNKLTQSSKLTLALGMAGVRRA